ncbi:hypothetical protein [Montanilutibacter psychrotolerans]|nr:hypothetical protein [Lysobacter psychrotolerans]
MRALLCLVLSWSCPPAVVAAGVALWDALPAIDVTHLQDANTGEQACPLCRHGYDAGGFVASTQRGAIALRSGRRVTASAVSRITGRERVVGLPCEGCEAVFQGIPANPGPVSRIATEHDAGDRLLLTGTVRNLAGKPQANIVVYTYQTDARGRYPSGPGLSGAAARHGRLRAWARTDASGRYTFTTVRPGAYPDRTTPAHIHLHVIEPGRCTYYLGDVLFAGDPRLSSSLRARDAGAHGGPGIVQLSGDGRDGWRAIRDIHLGRNVSGYAACSG